MCWETKINTNKVFELRCRTMCYFGVGAIHKMNDISENLNKRGIRKLIVVTDKIVPEITGAWKVIESALKTFNLQWVIYNGVTPNPTVEEIDESTSMGKDFGAQAVIMHLQ